MTRMSKKVEIYVNSNMVGAQIKNILSPFGIVHFPEKEKMPIDAVKYIKNLIDQYLNARNCSKDNSLYIETYSTDIINFTHEYGKLKKYKVQIYYRNRKIGIEGVFKKFNAVFRYINKVTTYKYYAVCQNKVGNDK